jgi:RND family efflux transporter MFP subunit
VSTHLSHDLASLKIDRGPGAPRKSPLRGVLWLLLLGALGAGLYKAYPQMEAKFFKAEVKLTEISMISPAQSQIQLTAPGYVQAQLISKVGAKITGKVAKVLFKEGDTVKKGELIAVLEDNDARSAVASAQSKVLAASARVQTARANLSEQKQQSARQKLLVANNAAPRNALEDAVAREASLAESVNAAQAEVKAARAEVNTLQVNLQYSSIVAPIGGTVVAKPVEVGELVGPATGPIMEIADFESLRVEADVPESKLYQVKIGAPTEITLDAYPGERYRGAVEEIGRRINRSKATVTVKVKFTDDVKGVLPDMAARCSFLQNALTEQALKQKPKKVIPGGAVASRGGRRVVFVAEGGKVRQQDVKLGDKVGSGFELLDGPGPGTKVVLSPPATLEDGQSIKDGT